MLNYLSGSQPATLIATPGLSVVRESLAATTVKRDDVCPGPGLSFSYPLWPGRDNVADPHYFLHYPPPASPDDQEGFLPPVVTTYHGHTLVCPYGVDTDVICPDSKKTRLMIVTILRADGDERRAVRVIAWQGDNDTIHLTQPLPGETDVYEPSSELFGVPSARREAAEFRLALAVHGPTAILDADVDNIPLVTPHKALQA